MKQFTRFLACSLFTVTLAVGLNSIGDTATPGQPATVAATPAAPAVAAPTPSTMTATDGSTSTTGGETKIETQPAKIVKVAPKKKGFKKMFALFDTTMGKFKVHLFLDQVPMTVNNFVGLAEGTKEWTDPETKKKKRSPLYDGVIFHRVIPDFMIQGGDPLGRGVGGPGYQFKDEFYPDLHHDKPGILSMANSGPNTNGSQFFITTVATPWLDGKHTIFGEVVDGMDVVMKISKTPRDSSDKPKTPVVINKVTIIRQ